MAAATPRRLPERWRRHIIATLSTRCRRADGGNTPPVLVMTTTAPSGHWWLAQTSRTYYRALLRLTTWRGGQAGALPTEVACTFSRQRVREQFRAQREIRCPVRIAQLHSRAHAVVMGCLSPDERRQLAADSGGSDGASSRNN